MNEAIEREYAKVIREIELGGRFSVNKDRRRFLEGADPWVIALARSIGECTVISAETKTLTNYGLGAVCKVLGVEHMSLVKYFQASGL
jgi:hypothetical protein